MIQRHRIQKMLRLLLLLLLQNVSVSLMSRDCPCMISQFLCISIPDSYCHDCRCGKIGCQMRETMKQQWLSGRQLLFHPLPQRYYRPTCSSLSHSKKRFTPFGLCSYGCLVLTSFWWFKCGVIIFLVSGFRAYFLVSILLFLVNGMAIQ